MKPSEKSLYNTDFYEWIQQQKELLQKRQFDRLDLDNLIEEVDSMGRSEYHSLKSALEELLLHLLKWQMQSARKDDQHDMEEWYRSWRVSIYKQRRAVLGLLEQNPGLQRLLDEIMLAAYKHGRKGAAIAMQCKTEEFPEECPWSYDKIMEENWLP